MVLNTVEANLECIQVLMGPRLSAAWQAHRKALANRNDLWSGTNSRRTQWLLPGSSPVNRDRRAGSREAVE